MNKKYFMLILLGALFGQAAHAATHSGTLDEEIIIAPGVVQNNIIHFYSDSASYTNGGLTFTYPSGLFSEAPNVTISLQSTGFTSALLSARIISNSATSTTIEVNSGTLVLINEIANGAATVHIWAVAQ